MTESIEMADQPESQLWGGRFKSQPSAALTAISQSIHFDWRLARYDLIQTMAHASSLLDAGILSASEFDELRSFCDEISSSIKNGTLTYQASDEDVHTAIERIITEQFPDIGTKIRTGRSRNDQVATDLRLYVRDQNQRFVGLILDLIEAIKAQAEQVIDLPSPGFTHLQHAQPVTFGHELAKHAHALHRVCDRAIELDKRIAVSPLGAGALAGSAFSLDNAKTAKLLGFATAAENSIDATTDRDYVVEFLFNVSLAAIHLSRISEEIILMTGSEFGFLRLDDSWSTGSSLMPQKKNPDIAELTRGKTGRFIGNLITLLTVLKALPFGYNRDLQEDKEALFDSVDQINLVLPAMVGLITTLRVDRDKLESAALSQHAAATDIADYLVRKGMPFREAHRITGELVLLAEEAGVDVNELELSQFRSISALIEPDLIEQLTAANILSVRSSSMGTAPVSVRRQLQDLAPKIATIRSWASNPLVVFL
ncbi:MAG: argininosuccinate lyase [Actinomycetota bacterium]